LSAVLIDQPLVALRDVGKRFANGVEALQGLSLQIARGGFVSLLGPSGCGKSTALRLIAGLSRPSSGEIRFFEDTPSGQSIGFVFQEPTLMPWARVAANVGLPLKLMGISAKNRRSRIAEALELVGLEAFPAAFPRELSGGMKMRVAIARALITRPKLLLMDEPFAALDEITRFRLNDDLQRLRLELNCTVIFVTHSVYESAYLSSRIVVMAPRPGRIIADIEVGAPLPRADDFRSSPIYHAACRDASRALHGAMTTGDDM
jgi:NitT/TauT family transport system ATP-binding protein